MPWELKVSLRAGAAGAAGSTETASPVGDSAAQSTDISEEAMEEMILATEGQLPRDNLTASVSQAEAALQLPESAARVVVKAERKHRIGKEVGGKAEKEGGKQQGGTGAVNDVIVEQGNDGDSQSLWDKVKGGVGGAAGAVAGTAVGTWGGVKGWWAARKEAERELEAEELRGDVLYKLLTISTYLSPWNMTLGCIDEKFLLSML